MLRKQFCASLTHTHKHTQYFVKMFLCPSLHGKMCFPPKHKLLCKLQPAIQESAFLVANSADHFGTSSEQTHQKKRTLGEQWRSKQPEFTIMNLFGSPEEHFHGRDYFKMHSGNTELRGTKKKPAKTKPNSINNCRNQKLLVLVPRSWINAREYNLKESRSPHPDNPRFCRFP